MAGGNVKYGHPNSPPRTMKTLFALILAGTCSAATAQTPAANPMPDGSRDMYVGLGVLSAAEHQGARERAVSLLPLVQMEWSSGIFVSGMSVGMHLSRQPAVEFGPLLVLEAGRDQNGTAPGAGGVFTTSPGNTLAPGHSTGATDGRAIPLPGDNRLIGMGKVPTRLTAGGFVNVYLTPELRLTNSVLYGSGRERQGVIWNVGLQHIAADIAPNHRLSVMAGMTFVNRSYNESYFGVSDAEYFNSGNAPHYVKGGVRDTYLGARWNWLLTPAWMVTTSARLSRLQDDSRKSPLVQRPTDVSVSTGLVYRF